MIEDEMYGMIEINGKKYLPVEQPKRKTGRMGLIAHALASVEMFGANTYHRTRPTVNIVEEYKLIQDKKSNLCRSDRDWVEYQFSRMYKEV